MQPFCMYTCASIIRSALTSRRSRSGFSASLGMSSQRYRVAPGPFTRSLLSSLRTAPIVSYPGSRPVGEERAPAEVAGGVALPGYDQEAADRPPRPGGEPPFL